MCDLLEQLRRTFLVTSVITVNSVSLCPWLRADTVNWSSPWEWSCDFEIHLKTFIFRKSFNVFCIRDSQYSRNAHLKQCRYSARSSHWITAMLGRMPWQTRLQENESVLPPGHPVHLLLVYWCRKQGRPCLQLYHLAWLWLSIRANFKALVRWR